jgi:hypothetical protein
MAPPKPIAKILTANRLRTGDTVYYTREGTWSPHVAEAEVATTETDVEALKRAGATAFAANAVIDVDLIDVKTEPPVTPAHIREVIRAKGPTVRLDLNKPTAPPQR